MIWGNKTMFSGWGSNQTTLKTAQQQQTILSNRRCVVKEREMDIWTV